MVEYYLLVTVFRMAAYSIIFLVFERSVLVWVRDDSIVEYTGGDLDWHTINVGGFGAWLLVLVPGEVKVCTWCRFSLALR